MKSFVSSHSIHKRTFLKTEWLFFSILFNYWNGGECVDTDDILHSYGDFCTDKLVELEEGIVV